MVSKHGVVIVIVIAGIVVIGEELYINIPRPPLLFPIPMHTYSSVLSSNEKVGRNINTSLSIPGKGAMNNQVAG